MRILTNEEKLLGIEPKETENKTNIKDLTAKDKFEVFTKDKDNKSVENGVTIACILPYEYKLKLMKGTDEIEYGSLVIRRVKKETKKVDLSTMTYPQMVEYVKKHGLKPATNKKADLIKAIEG